MYELNSLSTVSFPCIILLSMYVVTVKSYKTVKSSSNSFFLSCLHCTRDGDVSWALLSYWLSLAKIASHLHKVENSQLLVACHAQRSLSLVSPDVASAPLKWMGSCRFVAACRWRCERGLRAGCQRIQVSSEY